MITFEIFVLEKEILNTEELYECLESFKINNDNLTLVIGEGPDLKEIYHNNRTLIDILENFCNNNRIDKNRIKIETGNLLQPNYWPNIFRFLGCDVFLAGQTHKGPYEYNKQIKKHFGCFVGSARFFRLCLSSYLYLYHRDKTLQTFQQKEFPINYYLKQTENIELKNNIKNFYPVLPLNKDPVAADNGYINWDKAFYIIDKYNDFFLDVVCETWHNGITFYPTEKTGRALFTKTPFIVFGPKNYLSNLQKIGYKTFSNIIDESYDQYTGEERLDRMNKEIDKIATMSLDDLNFLQKDLEPLLEHNKKIYLSHNQNKIEAVLL